MPTLTMTPCYSIMLSFLALVLIIIITGPFIIIMLRRAWDAFERVYIKIKNKKRY